mmetsp:Transcript_60112/g.143251  ORF Transcript_60112/g.143251 Transcript_60112/m.143251 type:complete len:267 (-) Transcript_60112:130-930(-)
MQGVLLKNIVVITSALCTKPSGAANAPLGVGLLRTEAGFAAAAVAADGEVREADSDTTWNQRTTDALMARAEALQPSNGRPCRRSSSSFVDDVDAQTQGVTTLESSLEQKIVAPHGGAKHAKVKIASADICLGLLIEWTNISFTLEPCAREFGDKVWSYNAWKQIGVAKDVVCLEGDPYTMDVLVQSCAEKKTAKHFKNQQWKLDLNRRRLSMANKPNRCLTVQSKPNRSNIGLADCNEADPAQQWVFIPQKYAAGHEPFENPDDC